MTLIERIEEDLKRAVRLPSREEREVEVLRLLKSVLVNAEIEKRGRAGREAKLSETEAVSEIQKVIKSLKGSLALYRQGGREDLVFQTEEELSIMGRYVPEQVGEAEVREAVKKIIASMGKPTAKEFGAIMKEVMKQFQGRADGAVVAKAVKEMLED